jgi:hypothetical protein
MAWWVPQSLDNFFKAATFLAVTVPTATVIMYVDQLVMPRLLGVERRLDRVPSWNQAAFANWPGIVALLVGMLYGAYGSGIVPGQDSAPSGILGEGVVPFQAWVLGGVLYLALAALAARSAAPAKALGFPEGATTPAGD